MRNTQRVLVLTTMVVLAAAGTTAVLRSVDPVGRSGSRLAPDQERPFAVKGLGFVLNRGQIASDAHYYLDGSGSAIWMEAGGLRFVTGTADATLRFEEAAQVTPTGIRLGDTTVNSYVGNESSWRAGLPVFGGVRYEQLWHGIDATYRTGPSSLKYSFRVAPGADPESIRLRYEQAALRVDGAGALHVTTPSGAFVDAAPKTYQLIDGTRSSVHSGYELGDDGEYGFRLGSYDPSRPLIIDPAIVYSGFVGGAGGEYGGDVSVDAAGNAYVSGQTDSTGFGTVGDTTPDGDDAYVAKVRPDGSGLEWVTLLGGSGSDYSEGIEALPAGGVFITGGATTGFPATVGDTSYNGGSEDIFLARLDANGTLLFSTLLGGGGSDEAFSVVIDSAGRPVLAGETNSTDFPATVGPDTSYGGNGDGVVARFSSDGTQVLSAGYIGGSGNEFAWDVVVGPGDGLYLNGSTESSDFPFTVGPGTMLSGVRDSWVAKVKHDGSGFDYAGTVGGSASEDGYGVAVDTQGNAYVTGETGSMDFPTPGGFDTTHNSFGTDQDIFVAKVNPSGTGLLYGTFLGGGGFDNAYDVTVDGSGAAYVAGYTDSSNYPTTGDTGSADYVGGSADGIVTALAPSGAALLYSGYLGGTDYEFAYRVALDRAASLYVTGGVKSPDYPTAVGPDTSHNSPIALEDGLITKLLTVHLCQGRRVTILGTESTEKITGTAGKDVIRALGGNDKVSAKGGADRVCGGKGNDKLKGGGGNDRLLGEQGSDDLSAGGGSKDVCKGGPGKDDGKACEKGKV